MEKISYKFSGEIHTDNKGNQTLVDFYNFCCNLSNATIHLDWSNLYHMDANLSALFCAIIFKLKSERTLSFYLDYSYLKGPMSIFWRNGLAQYIYKTGNKPDDTRFSTIQLKAFKIDAVDAFVNYIQQDLLRHRGVENIHFHDKTKVKDSYFEIFNNCEIHSQSSSVIACGQFFPQQKALKFTMVDLGCGFLKNISKYTENTDKIEKAEDAIGWAIRGNSTKIEAKGGTGLKKILFYCMKSGSSIHIVSDDCYWKYDGGITNYRINKHFVGTTIHLIFRYS